MARESRAYRPMPRRGPDDSDCLCVLHGEQGYTLVRYDEDDEGR